MTDRTCAARRRVATIALGAAVACIALAGCGGPEAASPVATPVTPERMSAEARASLPAGFPREVPVLAGEITVAEVTGGSELGPWRVVLVAPVTVADTFTWYRDAFVAASWQVGEERAGASGAALVLGKGAGAWATVSITRADAGATVEMWVGLGVPMPAEAVPEELDTI